MQSIKLLKGAAQQPVIVQTNLEQRVNLEQQAIVEGVMRSKLWAAKISKI